MARLAPKERALLREVTDQLGTVRAGSESVFDTCLPLLRPLLGLEAALLWDLRETANAFTIERAASSGFAVPRQTLISTLNGLFGSSQHRWSIYNPARPEPQQRNVSLMIEPFPLFMEKLQEQSRLRLYGITDPDQVRHLAEGVARSSMTFSRLGLSDHWQLRALVCEQESLLAWVGGFSEERPTERTHLLLNCLVPSLRRRLLLERTLDRGPMAEASIAATMEAIPRSAFLANHAGQVLQANAAGQAQLAREPTATRRLIAEALRVRGDAGPFQVTEVIAAGRKPLSLLVGRAPAGVEDRLASRVRRWSLTKRQEQILRLVVRGDANRTIAARLACAERTVELHVAALMNKACTETRAALIATFFMGG